MAQKSRQLDKSLSELICPLGFKRIPKTRQFIRLCGDGVFQGVYWYHEPRYTAQELEWWIESVYSDPEQIFRPYLTDRNHAIMTYSVSCASYEYDNQEYLPTRVFSNPPEERQLKAFQERILPRLERWKYQKDVFLAHRGSETATAEGHPQLPPRYSDGRDLNLALLLDKQDEAIRYLEEPLAWQRERIKSRLDRGISIGWYDKLLLERYQSRANLLITPEAIQDYLQQCKEQNLLDFDDLMNGKRGE